MKTLIFANTKFNKGRNGAYYTTEFVKEGDITDAMNYFDGSRHFGSFFHNDEKGYYWANNDNGRPAITDEEIENGNGEHNVTVDVHAFWTRKIDNLDIDEIKALVEDGDRYTIADALEANGYDVDAFEVAQHFKDLDKYFDAYENWCEFDIYEEYNVSEVEPEDDNLWINSFEYNGKFYTEK